MDANTSDLNHGSGGRCRCGLGCLSFEIFRYPGRVAVSRHRQSLAAPTVKVDTTLAQLKLLATHDTVKLHINKTHPACAVADVDSLAGCAAYCRHTHIASAAPPPSRHLAVCKGNTIATVPAAPSSAAACALSAVPAACTLRNSFLTAPPLDIALVAEGLWRGIDTPLLSHAL